MPFTRNDEQETLRIVRKTSQKEKNGRKRTTAERLTHEALTHETGIKPKAVGNFRLDACRDLLRSDAVPMPLL